MPSLEDRKAEIIQNKVAWLNALPAYLDKLPHCLALYDWNKRPMRPKSALLLDAGRALYPLAQREREHLTDLNSARNAAYKHRDAIAGVTFLMDKAQRLFCFDLDSPAKKLQEKQFAAFTPQEKALLKVKYEEINADILAAFAGKTYIEKSMSGNGWHIIGYSSRDIQRMNFDLCGSIFTHSQFIHLTGDLAPGSQNDIYDCGDIAAAIIEKYTASGDLAPVKADADALSSEMLQLAGELHHSHGRVESQSFEEFAARIGKVNKASYAFLMEGKVCAEGHSDSMMRLIGDADKVEANPSRMFEWIMGSKAIVGHEWNADRTQNRVRKWHRNFIPELARRRPANDRLLAARAAERAAQDEATAALYARPEAAAQEAPVAIPPADDDAEWAALCAAAQEAAASAGSDAAPAPIPQAERPALMEEAQPEEAEANLSQTPRFQMNYPPGNIGRLAFNFYQMSPYPNQTQAIASAFAAASGLAGRSYHVNGIGLNLFIMCLAETGSGKETLNNATMSLFFDLSRLEGRDQSTIGFKKIRDYIGPSRYSSETAMYKKISKQPKLLSVMAEMSFFFEAAAKGDDQHSMGVRRALLDLFTKSKPNAFVKGKEYADDEKNHKDVHSPTISLIGEGQPDKFYRSLGSADAEDGLLNRFDIFDCSRASRGPRNKDMAFSVDEDCIRRFMPLARASIADLAGPDEKPEMLRCGFSPEANALSDQYEANVIDKLNMQSGLLRYQLLNRSLARAWVYAALMACADLKRAEDLPIISGEQMAYALDLVYRERCHLLKMFESDATGEGDANRIAFVLDKARNAITVSKSSLITRYMKEHCIVSHHFLWDACKNNSNFKANRHLGASDLLTKTIRAAIENGSLVKIDVSDKLYVDGLLRGACYRVPIR